MNDIRITDTGWVTEPGHYEIRVEGHLADRWATWFDGMTLTAQDNGTTIITGPVSDQSELHGLLGRLRDIGLTLISLSPTAPLTHGTPDPT